MKRGMMGGMRAVHLLVLGLLLGSSPSRADSVPPVPAAPHGLEAAVSGRDSVILSWRPNREADLAGYVVERCEGDPEDPGCWTSLTGTDPLGGSETYYQDRQVELGRTYHYRLRALSDSGGESDPSEVVPVLFAPDLYLDLAPRSEALVRGGTSVVFLLGAVLNDFNGAEPVRLEAEVTPSLEPGLLVGFLPGPELNLTRENPWDLVWVVVRSQPDTRLDNYQVKIRATGTDESGLVVERESQFRVRVLDPEESASIITLGVLPESVELGEAVYAFGQIVPTPLDPEATRVTLRVEQANTGDGYEIPDIPVDEDGRYEVDLQTVETGLLRLQSSWPGDGAHDPDESDWESLWVERGPSRVHLYSDLGAEQPSGTLRGYIVPAPDPGVQARLLYHFFPMDEDPPWSHEESVPLDGSGLPGSFARGVDLSAPPFPQEPGVMVIHAAWGGSGLYQPAISAPLLIPRLLPPAGLAVVVAAGDPAETESWAAYREKALFAHQVLGRRGFDRAHRIFLSADPTDPQADGPATLEALQQVLAQAIPGSPVVLYVAGPTTRGHLGYPDGTFRLNPIPEYLSGQTLNQLLAPLPPDSPPLLYLDGDRTGNLIFPVGAPGRTIIAPSGFGQALELLDGRVGLSRRLLTLISRGGPLRSAVLETYLLAEGLAGILPVELPMVDTGNGWPNEWEDFRELDGRYLGYSLGNAGAVPELLDVSPPMAVPRYAGGAEPKSTGGMTGWLRYSDPEESLGLERCAGLGILIGPDGGIQQVFPPDVFQPDPAGELRLALDIPADAFQQSGVHGLVLFTLDPAGHLSLPGVTYILATEHRPLILAAGFGETRLDSKGGWLSFTLLGHDGNGSEDIQGVYVEVLGLPVELPFQVVERPGPELLLLESRLEIPPGVSPMATDWRAVLIDSAGLVSDPWPAFTVPGR